MIPRPQRFELRFQSWLEARAIEGRRLERAIGRGETTSLYHFRPSGAARRTVLALHGAGNDALFGWIGLFKRLLEGGSEVLSLELPGHGRAGRSIFEGPRARDLVQELLGEAGPGNPLHAIGISLGGSVLLSSLARGRHPLTSATVVGAPLEIEFSGRALSREIGARTLRTLWREREHYGWTGLIPSFGSFKRELYPLRLAGAPPPGRFGYVEVLNREIAALLGGEEVHENTTPVLMLYGTHDLLVPLRQGEHFRGLFPRARLHPVAGATHLSTPFEPEALRAFLAWIEAHER